MSFAPYAVAFPGQGSQKKGMLATLAQAFPRLSDTFTEASDALGFDLWQLVQTDDRLNETRFTQPALLTSAIAIWRLLQVEGALVPSWLLGHSLGEYAALVAAEVLPFDTAVKLVALRGQLMQQAVPAGEGCMIAVMGLSPEQVNEACAEAFRLSGSLIEPANLNAPGQIVVAGLAAAADTLTSTVKTMGGKALRLPVSVPSHCSLMSSAAAELAAHLGQLPFATARIPVIVNTLGRPVSSGEALREALVQQLTQPVRWVESEQFLLNNEVSHLIECGPGNVLTGLAKRLPPLTGYPTDQPDLLQNVLSLVTS